MQEYFTYPYQGAAFVQLGPAHLSVLVVFALIILALWHYKVIFRDKKLIRLSLAGLLLVNELFWHAWHAYYGLWDVRTLLPLNICNLMVFTSVWALLTLDRISYDFIYLLGIPAGMQILVTPALGPYGFPHILFFQIFISHGGIIVAALYLTFVEQMRPQSWKAVRRVAVWTTLYAGAVFVLNRFLNSNYLFLAYKPPAQTLIDFLGPWPWYILAMEGIGIILVVLVYLPFHLLDKKVTTASNN